MSNPHKSEGSQEEGARSIHRKEKSKEGGNEREKRQTGRERNQKRTEKKRKRKERKKEVLVGLAGSPTP